MTLAPRSAGYLALLVALGSFGPLTMNIYTPVMPSVGANLGAGSDSVKLTLTTYMLGFAVSPLFYGPLSDRYGRRPILIVGVLFFTLATFACSFAPTIGGLIGLRILQGLGAASGSVLSRALTRDAYSFRDMPMVMSWISLAMNIAPSLAPTLGGFLGETFGWRATFWFVGGFGLILLVVALLGLGETNRHRSATAISSASCCRWDSPSPSISACSWAPLSSCMVRSFGSGFLVPTSSAGAVGMFPKLAGTAASWVGLAQMGMGAMGTIAVAVLSLAGSRYVAMPPVVGLLPFGLLTVLSARLLRSPRTTAIEPYD